MHCNVSAGVSRSKLPPAPPRGTIATDQLCGRPLAGQVTCEDEFRTLQDALERGRSGLGYGPATFPTIACRLWTRRERQASGGPLCAVVSGHREDHPAHEVTHLHHGVTPTSERRMGAYGVVDLGATFQAADGAGAVMASALRLTLLPRNPTAIAATTPPTPMTAAIRIRSRFPRPTLAIFLRSASTPFAMSAWFMLMVKAPFVPEPAPFGGGDEVAFLRSSCGEGREHGRTC